MKELTSDDELTMVLETVLQSRQAVRAAKARQKLIDDRIKALEDQDFQSDELSESSMLQLVGHVCWQALRLGIHGLDAILAVVEESYKDACRKGAS